MMAVILVMFGFTFYILPSPITLTINDILYSLSIFSFHFFNFFYSYKYKDILDTEYPHTGYHVHEDVDHHTGRGFGIYTNFTQAPVFADCGLKFPNKADVKIENPMVLDLDSKGGFKNVLRKGGKAFGEFKVPAVKTSHGWSKPGFGP